jgi:proliferating cell nuclear antigen
MKVLELKTLQTTVMKILIESLKEILIDVNIEFSKDLIKITKMDISHTILVNLEIDPNKFEYYNCDYTQENPLILGVNIINLYKLLKTLNNEDILSLYVDNNNSGILEINIENASKGSITKYMLNLIEIDEETIKMPSTTFDNIIVYNSNNFQKLIKDMSSLSDTIEIKSYNNQLMFSCHGDFVSQETIINETTDDIKFTRETDTIFQGCYLTKHLVSFIKCTNLSSNIKIYLKNDYPLIIEYSIGNLGKITLVVAQKS